MIIIDKKPKLLNRKEFNAKYAAYNGFSIFGKNFQSVWGCHAHCCFWCAYIICDISQSRSDIPTSKPLLIFHWIIVHRLHRWDH